MAPYTYSNNNFYDPVGGQSGQPQGYTYANQQHQQQGASSSSPYPSNGNATYQPGYNQGYNNAYSNQQYSTTGQHRASASTTRPTSAVGSLNNQNYSQSTSENRSSNLNTQYDNAYYGSAGFSAMSDRSQSNNSPHYTANSSVSTFGRISLPEQSQTSSRNLADTQTYQQSSSTNASTPHGYQNLSESRSRGSYQNAYTAQQNQQQQPQRYASPLHAVQAQHGHSKQASRNSNHAPSPQLTAHNAQQLSAQHRQQSASAEPSQTTVDPSQVYDMRAEQQRKAQVEAEKRRKVEATRKLEEEARVAEAARQKADKDNKAEEERKARDTGHAAKKAEEDAKKKAAQERKNAQQRKAREEKRESKTAATALTQMASSAGMDAMASMMGDMSAPPANDDEAEMRAMFRKMREFNAKNPEMLAKLWEEERTQHATQSASPTQSAQSVAPSQSTPKQKQSQKQAQRQPATASAAVSTSGPSASTASLATPAPPATSVIFSNAVPEAPAAQQQYKPKPTPATQAPPQPVVQQASTALWPPHKKGSLAEAAATWLNNLPENASFGRAIAMEEILKILDTNPSYVQLCESIERTHIRFERSALAKELLKAVPDGLKSNQSAAKPSNSSAPMTGPVAQTTDAGSFATTGKKKRPRASKDGPLGYVLPSQQTVNTGPVAYQSPAFSSLTDAARQVNSEGTAPAFHPGMSTVASALTVTPAVQSPYFTARPGMIGNGNPELQQQTDIKSETSTHAPQPDEPRRPPADKEEAARKRTFGDLVDLTANDDSDDDGPPRKLQQPMSGTVNGFIKPPPSSDHFRQPITHTEYWRQRAGSMPGGIQAQNQMHSSGRHWLFNAGQKPPIPVLSSQKAEPPPPRPKGPTEELKQQERMRGKMLVEPIMRDRVARKSKYDSRTIARDVLLATGRHPDMRPLNFHLNPMQKLLGDHGGAIDGAGNKSDLSTIRWDIIDPGQSTQTDDGKTSIIRGDVTLDVDSTDDDHTLQAQRNGGMDETFSRQNSETSAARLQQLKQVATPEEWERIGEDKMRRKLSNRYNQRQWKQRHDAIRKTPMESIVRAGEGDRITSFDRLPQHSDGQDVAAKWGINEAAGAGAKKQRGPGRPRKGSRGSFASPSVNNNNNTRSTPATSPAARGTPEMSGGAVGYSAFRHYDENGNVIKKKGRPVGWRKNIHSREAAGLTPIKSGNSSAKAALQRPRLPQDFVKPSYQAYACKWRNCTAELDNLERLKKHVLKLHGAADMHGVFECQWSSCRSAGTHVDEDGKASSRNDDIASFQTQGHWMNHVYKEHLEQVAWQLGDGPRGGAVSDYRSIPESYLSDSHGRSVTPIIVPMAEPTYEAERAESTESILTSDLPAPKRLGRPRKNPTYHVDGSLMTKAERDAMDELDRLKNHKLHEGITMGRESSRLANEKRRNGFLDDEDFEDIIEDSD